MKFTIVLAVLLLTLNLSAQDFPIKVLDSLATSYDVDVKVVKTIVNKYNYKDTNIISAIPEDGYECLISNQSTDDGFYIYKSRYYRTRRTQYISKSSNYKIRVTIRI